jgi:hypothetical protein
MTWVCLRVASRQERQIADRLRTLGVLAYAPTEVRKVVVKHPHKPGFRRVVPGSYALMPSYCFVNITCDQDIDIARSDRRVREIMADPFGSPKRVDTRKLAGLFLAEAFKCFDETWEPPKPKGYSRRYKPGDRVKHEYAGWLGVVLQTRRDQCIEVMFRAFGKEMPFVVKEEAVIAEKDVTLSAANGKERLEAA